MTKRFVIHPLLFALFPVLALYAHNMGELSLSQLWIPLAGAAGFAILVLLIAWLVFRDITKAGIAASVAVVLFFSYGHMLGVLQGWGVGITKVGGVVVGTPARYVLLAWVIVFVAALYLSARTRRDLRNATAIFNVVGITLILVSSVSIGAFELRRPDFNLDEPNGPAEAILTETDDFPDIYYIILDGYGRASTLERYYGFDNSSFIDYLSASGFYVATQSNTNFVPTAHSLASSLNMELVNYLGDEVGEGSRDMSLIYEMVRNSEVLRFLKSRGYTCIQVGSEYESTRVNPYVDIDFPLPMVGFPFLLYKSTMLYLIPEALGVTGEPSRLHWNSALYQFDRLAEIQVLAEDTPEPIFVFAHVVIPHLPYVFDRDGSFVSAREEASRTVDVSYVNQLIFCNSKLRALVDDTLSGAGVPPVVILQGDHGPWGYTHLPDYATFSKEEKMRILMGNLNAYHLPGNCTECLYESITPVNSFRAVLNCYFGTDYELEEDRSFVSGGYGNPYKFTEVTDMLGSD